MKNRNTNMGFDSEHSRRQFLKLTGYGTLGLIVGGFWRGGTGFAAGQTLDTEFIPDIDIALSAHPDEVAVFPGAPTRVWRYHATVHKGSRARIVEIPGSYIGPIIRVRKGEKIRIRFKNEIPEETIVHWHGLHVPAIMDGHPRYVIPQGKSYLYEFEVQNRAGTYWYHPHPHGRTGPQVYRGLAGLFLVSDEEELAVGLPNGEYDVPLVIQDRVFDHKNQLVYMSGHRMEQMSGFLGDMIMVNGLPDFTLPVSTGAYRLRLLNGSNSRIYKLAWEDGRPITIIATDGGLLERPVYRRYAFLSPGERLEIWVDFSDNPVGYRTSLLSLSFDAGGMGGGRMGRGMMMGGRMVQNQSLPNGAAFSVFKVNVTQPVKTKYRLPDILSEIGPLQQDEVVNFYNPRQFYLTMQHMQWTINGRILQMEEVADDEIVQLGSTEIWEFNNTGGGMMHMMNMPHPIYLHGSIVPILSSICRAR
jgi:FtsP/CotA-like multicopper oxidase with cupredoxin domain